MGFSGRNFAGGANAFLAVQEFLGRFVTILCSVMKIGAPPPARAPDNFRSRAVKRPARLPAYTICGVRAGAQAADVSASSIGREGRVLSQGVVLRFCALGASSTQPKATLQRSTPSVERNARWFSQTPQKGCEGRRELSSATSAFKQYSSSARSIADVVSLRR